MNTSNSSNSSYPVVSGVLSIVSGAFGFLGGLAMILISVLFWSTVFISTNTPDEFPFFVFQTIYIVWGIILLVISVLAVIGGIYSLKRKNWGMALTGAIASVLTFFPGGVVAVIFVALGKQEFE